MINVLTSTKYVLDQLKDVKVDLKAIESLISRVKEGDLQVSEISLARKR